MWIQISKFEINNAPMRKTLILDSGIEWPIVGVSSWVHGNEHFWVQVTRDFLKRVSQENLFLLRGKVILILEGNEQALKSDERFLINDLNRVVNAVPQDEVRDNYEQRRWAEIRRLIDTMQPEHWLDLHSFSAPTGLPYAFSGLDGYRRLGAQLGIQNMAVNMANANKKSDGWKLISRGVADYVNDSGANGFTFEAGFHRDPQCLVNTYQALVNFLVTQEMIEPKEVDVCNNWNSWQSSIWLMPHTGIVKIWGIESRHVHIEEKHIFKGDFSYAGWHPQSFKKYIKWEVIGYDIEDGEIKWVVNAPYDGYIIMPKDPKVCEVWKEVFYYGKDMSEVSS